MFEVSGLVESILSVFDSKQYEYTGVSATTLTSSTFLCLISNNYSYLVDLIRW